MDYKLLFNDNDEKPLERLIFHGGFCGIFRKIGCVGDSLSSGEFEGTAKDGSATYHDYYEYSWGQHIARNIGAEVYNFSRGGMTAKEYCESFADERNLWDKSKACQAYIFALGANDITQNGKELGSVSDIKINNWENNKKTFVGYYAQIIQRLKEIQPKAKFFLITIPRGKTDSLRIVAEDIHQHLLYQMAELFENTYILDFRKYAPVYDEDFKRLFYLGSHMNPAGYILTARMVESYIDYIIRHDMESFAQAGFIGTPYHNAHAKW